MKIKKSNEASNITILAKINKNRKIRAKTSIDNMKEKITMRKKIERFFDNAFDEDDDDDDVFFFFEKFELKNRIADINDNNFLFENFEFTNKIVKISENDFLFEDFEFTNKIVKINENDFLFEDFGFTNKIAKINENDFFDDYFRFTNKTARISENNFFHENFRLNDDIRDSSDDCTYLREFETKNKIDNDDENVDVKSRFSFDQIRRSNKSKLVRFLTQLKNFKKKNVKKNDLNQRKRFDLFQIEKKLNKLKKNKTNRNQIVNEQMKIAFLKDRMKKSEKKT